MKKQSILKSNEFYKRAKKLNVASFILDILRFTGITLAGVAGGFIISRVAKGNLNEQALINLGIEVTSGAVVAYATSIAKDFVDEKARKVKAQAEQTEAIEDVIQNVEEEREDSENE